MNTPEKLVPINFIIEALFDYVLDAETLFHDKPDKINYVKNRLAYVARQNKIKLDTNTVVDYIFRYGFKQET